MHLTTGNYGTIYEDNKKITSVLIDSIIVIIVSMYTLLYVHVKVCICFCCLRGTCFDFVFKVPDTKVPVFQ